METQLLDDILDIFHLFCKFSRLFPSFHFFSRLTKASRL